MPIYEYRCCNCGTICERLRNMSQKLMPTECDNCGHTANALEISKSSFALKGGGWFKDGYTSTKKGNV